MFVWKDWETKYSSTHVWWHCWRSPSNCGLSSVQLDHITFDCYVKFSLSMCNGLFYHAYEYFQECQTLWFRFSSPITPFTPTSRHIERKLGKKAHFFTETQQTEANLVEYMKGCDFFVTMHTFKIITKKIFILRIFQNVLKKVNLDLSRQKHEQGY